MKRIIFILILVLVMPGCQGVEREVTPVKYFDFDQHAIFDEDKSVTLLQKFNMLFKPSNEANRVFYLPHANDSNRKYGKVEAFFVSKDNVKVPLEVRVDEIRRNDIDDSRYFLKRPKVLLPITAGDEKIEVSFEMKFEVTGSGPSIVMYIPDEPVEQASVTVIGNGMDIQIDAVGFVQNSSPTTNALHQVYRLETNFGLEKLTSDLRSPRVTVTALKSWEMAATEMAASYERELAKDIDRDHLASLIGADILDMPSAEERIRLISNKLYDWLVSTFQYKAAYLNSRYSHYPRPLERIWKSRKGDCKDLSLVFVKLLSSFGIHAEPVLVVTSQHPLYPRFSALPTLEIFNHVVVFIPSLNTYVDVTLGEKSYLSMSDGLYEHTFGLHLGEKSYRKILSKNRNSRKVITHIKNEKGHWKASTQWVGQGQGQMEILSGFKYFDRLLKKSANPKKFEQNNVMLMLQSLKLQENKLEGSASVFFEYLFKQPVVDLNGNLINFPFVYSDYVFLEFNGLVSPFTFSTDICFANGISEEIIYIDGIEIKNFNQVKDNLRIDGISRIFTQKVIFNKNKLAIYRTLETNEERLNCPHDEIEKNKEFFRNIDVLKNKTIKQLVQY